MKQPLFRWLNTLLLITALAANLLPTLNIALASNQDAIIENTDPTISKPESSGASPGWDNPKSPLAGPNDFCVGARNAIYRAVEAPDPSNPQTAPSPRNISDLAGHVDPDPADGLPEIYYNDVPPFDVLPGAGSVDPDDPASKWQTDPPDVTAPEATFRNRTGAAGQAAWLHDVRNDPNGSYRLVRSEPVKLMIWLRNNTRDSSLCPEPYHSTGPDIHIKSVTYSIYDRSGLLTQQTVTDMSTFFVSGTPNTPSNGVIPETLGSPPNNNNAPSDIYTLIDYTIPETAVGYINFIIEGIDYCIGDNATCGSGNPTPPIETFNDSWNYVDIIGGPLATADIKIVGPETGRSVGENAWFVIELTSLLGTQPQQDPTIRTVTDNAGTLPECRTTGTAPGGGQGWYQSDFTPPFATLETVDPTTFTPGGTLFDYTNGSGTGADVDDMSLIQNDKIYCAFRKQLIPDASGNFTLSADLRVTGYPFPGGNELSAIVHVEKVFPLGQAALRVEKRIIGPLVNPPVIDPVTSEPRIKTVVNVGETVTYEITVTNVGDVDLNNITLIDSLIGPYTFTPANAPIHPEDSPGVCTSDPCSVTATLNYVVQFTDPNPIQNVVEARGRIVGTTFQVSDQDVASILKADSELQLVLTTADAPGGDGFQPGEKITYQLQYCNTGTAVLNSIEFLSGFPTKFDAGNAPGTLQYFQPAYPVVRQYLDTPPVPTSFSAPPFQPGICGTINFDYTIPNLGDPLFRDPIFQDIRMRAVRQDGTTIFGEAKLVTALTNNNINIEAKLWDPVTNSERTNLTVLRGEELMFDLEITNLSDTDRCNVRVNMYRLNSVTGAETLIASDLPINWPSSGDHTLGRISAIPAANVATTLPDAGDPINIYRPQYLVDGSTPDPLIIVFEVNAQDNCAGPPAQPQFIARQALVLDVTDVQIATTLEVRNRVSGARVTQGFYPTAGDITDYMLVLSATNVGPATMTINSWSYCILNSPVPEENCSSPVNEINMFDGNNTQGIPGAGVYPDFGVDQNFSPNTRQWTTLQNRTDRRAFDLLFFTDGRTYPNPLVIQVVIRGTDNKGTNVVIRDSVILPLITGDLNLTLSGPSTLVRGDFDVPINFAFQNITGGNLQNVRVVNLMEEDNSANGFQMPPGLGFDNKKYELCTYSPAQGGGTLIASIPAGDVSIKTGTCLFTFGNNIQLEEGLLRFRAAVIGTEQTTGNTIIDIRFLEIEVLPHLRVDKVGLQASLKTDRLPYTIIVTNQSAYQYVEFPAADGFSDVFSPTPDGQICRTPGGFPCPPTLADFSNLTPTGSNYRLSPGGIASVSYEIIPPAASGEHGANAYSNTATFTGNRQFDSDIVSGSDSHAIKLECPILWVGTFDWAHPDTDSNDLLLTLGESIRITIQGYNLSQTDLTFSSFQDLRFELDGSLPMTLNSITWPTGTVGLLPAAGNSGFGAPLTYSFTAKIRPEDYLTLLSGQAPDETNGPRGAPIAGESVLSWRMYYQTNLDDRGTLACYDSVPTNYIFWSFEILNPVRIDKGADRALAFTGQQINYTISIFNISEQVPMVVDSVDDTLLGNNQNMNFPGGTAPTGTLPIYNGTPAPVFADVPLIYQVPDNAPRNLVNTAVVNYHPGPGGPNWVDQSISLVNSDSVAVVTENPLRLTKQVVVPVNGVAPRGGTVEYLITLINESSYPVEGISLTDSRMTIPSCNPPGLVPPRCLDSSDNFSLLPGGAVQVVLQYTIPADEPGPSVANTATAVGTLIIEGVATPLPPVQATASVSLTEPALVLTTEIFADNACTQKLVDVDFPVDRDRNNDGIPEATVTELIYYQFNIFAGGGKTFRDIVLTADLQNGDASLTNNAQNALENHPAVTMPGVILSDNVNAAPEVPEVSLCIPYIISDRQPDPLVLIGRIRGTESNLESVYVAGEKPLDVGDPNIFISKTTDRIVAYPGQEVTYTLLIENKSQHNIEINDVYDDRLGGQLFFDDDNNPATPPVPGDYWRNPNETSLDFTAPIKTTPDGEGWVWPGPIGRLAPGESVTYTYKKTILNTDPDPLLNRAGVLATVLRPEGDVPAADETLNSLAITNSQLRVTKTAIPTATILGNTVNYSVSVLNIGDEPVYDIVIFDDRYDLQYGATPNSTQLLDGVNGVSLIGGDTCNGTGTNNDLGPAGATNPCSGDAIVATYSLPTQPTCVRWVGNVCDAYDNPAQDLPFIDPFVNTARATGFIEDPNSPGSLIPLDPPGSDTAIVDLINPGIRVEKTTTVGGAAIGSDVEYTIRVVNTGDIFIRIDEVIDVPTSNIPSDPTITTELPIDRMFFEDCPVPQGIQTSPAGATNLEGSALIPFSLGGDGANPATSPIQIDNTAILLPGCSAVATITVQVPNPYPNNEYTNVVQVNGVDGNGGQVTDLSSASIDIRSAGIEIAKRAWSCDTTPIGNIGNTQNSTGCTVNLPPANAQLLSAQDEGRFVFYEITLVNSGSDAFNRITVRDEMLLRSGGTTTPSSTLTVPNGTPYNAWNWRIDAVNTYSWQNGVLILEDKTPNVQSSYSGPGSYPADWGDGPFGMDDLTTFTVDESNLFEPGEAFVRLDPGPLTAGSADPANPDQIPAITYRHTVRLPNDASETITSPTGPRINYINRATVTGASTSAGVTPITNSSEYILEIRPAQLGVQLEACVDDDNNPATPYDWVNTPCNTIAQVESAAGTPQPAYIWYRLTLTNNADQITMRDIVVTDTVRGNIPTSDLCWDSNPGGSWSSQGILPPQAQVVCTYVRDDNFTPLTPADDPYTNTATATFKLDNGGLPPFPDGNPGTDSATIRITRGALLLTIVGCEDVVRAEGGSTLNFNVIVENVSPTNNITALEIYTPDINTGQPTLIGSPPAPTSLTAGQQVTLTNALRIRVPVLGPNTSDYTVSGFGQFLGSPLTATASCTIQRVDGDLVVTKDVVNPATGNATAQPGDVVNYTITIENLGLTTIQQMVVSDPRLEGAPGVTWNWPTSLQPGQSTSRTFSYTVPAGEDPIINTVTAQGNSGITQVTAQDDAQLAIADGDLVVSATAVPNPVFAGSSTTLNYQVCNLSTTINYSVITLDETIVGLTNPVTGSVTTPQGTPVTLPFVLNALQCLDFVHTVSTAAEDAGATMTSTMYVEGQDTTCAPTCGTTVSDSQNVDVPVIDPNADIVVEIEANKPTVSLPTDNIQFTVTVTNVRSTGNVNLTSITDTLGIFTGNTGIAGQSLAPFESRVVTLPYVFNGTPDPLFNEVSVDYTVVSSGVTGTATDNISIPVVAVAGANLIVQIFGPQTSTPGADITYRYDVTNIGGATVTDGYIDNRTFTPPTSCTNVTPNSWAAGGPANLIPPMPIGMTRSATVVCTVDPAFTVNTDLTHQVEVHRAGAAPTLQDNDTNLVRIVPPLELTLEQVNLAVPGGYAYIRYTVRNIGPTVVNNVSLTFNTPDLPTCDSTQASAPDTWIANPFGTDTGLNLLPVTPGQTQTFGIGETLVATLGCAVPVNFLGNQLRDTFTHNGDVTIQGISMDPTAVDVTVIQPIEFTFLPQNTPADVITPTQGGVAPTFLRAEDSTRLVFRLRNIGPPGFSAEGVDYNIAFTNQNGSTTGTLFCEQESVVTSWGGAFTGQMANPGDYIDVVCNYRPRRADAGLVKVLTIDVSHEVNGTTVDVPVPNPVMTATVEYLELLVRLTGVPDSQGQGESRVDDGDPVQYTLTIENRGSVPISTFQFTQSVLDLDTGQTVPNTENFLTPGSPVHTLTDLWNNNRNNSGARCPDPLGPGQMCVISGAVPLHLILPTDMNHIVVPADPNRFDVRVVGTARSTTASGFTITSTGSWRTVVQRPILRIGGPLSSVNKDQNGNVWIYVPTYITWTPNPAQLNSEVTFQVQIENAGFKNIFNPKLSGQISLSPTAAEDGFALMSNGAYQTPPVTLNFTITPTTLRRGEITTATATWTVEGVTPPTIVYLRLNFQADVEGNYPDYNFVTPPISVPIVADPNAPTTDPDGNALDPNATEPTVTKTASVESAQPGEPVSWTIEVTNGSTRPMTNVTLVDAVPGDLEIVSATTTAGASIVTGNLVEVTLGDLDPGERVTITINTNIALTASVPGIITNTAVASREGGQQISAEASVGVGTASDINPETGFGFSESTGMIMPVSGMVKHLPFLLGISSVFFFMLLLNVNFTNRQRIILAALALVVVALLIGGLLLLTSGESDDDTPPAGGTPVDEAGIFATATPLPTEVSEAATSTPAPTVPPEALATIESFPPTATPYILPTEAGPRRLDIPALNYSIPVPIVELPMINREWDVSNLGHNIGWLDKTTWFDPSWGNTVLVGHIQLSNSEPGPFQNLDRLAPGDEVYVYEGDLVRKFEVTEIFTVGAAETEVTHPTNDPVLTLITCTNWSDSRGVFSDRLVVRAVPVEDSDS